MSNQTSHPSAPHELDASVDAMADQLGGNHPAISTHNAPPVSRRPSSFVAAETDTLLREISHEIEQQAPGLLPTPPEPVAAAAPARAPTPADIAAAAADVDADLQAFEAPNELEIAPPTEPPGLEAEASGPGAEIRTLDAALAARAERSLLSDAASHAAAPAPIAPAPAPPAAVVSPAAAPAKQEPKLEPIVIAPAIEPEHATAPVASVQPGPTGAALLAGLTLPLRPIAALHEKLSEPTRQLIAYCAVVTLFAASCIWALPRFIGARAPEPTTAPTEFYDANTPAHGITAPAKHAEADKAGAHGEPAGHGESGHAEAKKPDTHGAKPKPEKKSSSKSKKPPPADEHGGH